MCHPAAASAHLLLPRRAKPDSITMDTTGLRILVANGQRALRKSETCFRISVALSARCSRPGDADSSSALYPIPILACLDIIGTRLDATFASDGLTDQAFDRHFLAIARENASQAKRHHAPPAGTIA
jgi:hypothetical protein